MPPVSKPILFLPCSGPKATGRLPAINKYTGKSVWGLLRKCPHRFTRLCKSANIVIVSAKYGLLYPHEYIDDYEATMTPQRLAVLTNNHQREKLQGILKIANGQSVYVGLPKAYRLLIEGLDIGNLSLCNTHYFAPGSGIGSQRRQLNQWVDAILSARSPTERELSPFPLEIVTDQQPNLGQPHRL